MPPKNNPKIFDSFEALAETILPRKQFEESVSQKQKLKKEESRGYNLVSDNPRPDITAGKKDISNTARNPSGIKIFVPQSGKQITVQGNPEVASSFLNSTKVAPDEKGNPRIAQRKEEINKNAGASEDTSKAGKPQQATWVKPKIESAKYLSTDPVLNSLYEQRALLEKKEAQGVYVTSEIETLTKDINRRHGKVLQEKIQALNIARLKKELQKLKVLLTTYPQNESLIIQLKKLETKLNDIKARLPKKIFHNVFPEIESSDESSQMIEDVLSQKKDALDNLKKELSEQELSFYSLNNELRALSPSHLTYKSQKEELEKLSVHISDLQSEVKTLEHEYEDLLLYLTSDDNTFPSHDFSKEVGIHQKTLDSFLGSEKEPGAWWSNNNQTVDDRIRDFLPKRVGINQKTSESFLESEKETRNLSPQEELWLLYNQQKKDVMEERNKNPFSEYVAEVSEDPLPFRYEDYKKNIPLTAFFLSPSPENVKKPSPHVPLSRFLK